jgi:hypothetical protein
LKPNSSIIKSTTRGITTGCIKAIISYTMLVIVINHTYLKGIIQDLLKGRDFDPWTGKGSNLNSIASCYMLMGFKMITMLVTVVGSIRQKDVSFISFNLFKQNPLSYYLAYLIKVSFQKSFLIIIISQESICPNPPSRLYR